MKPQRRPARRTTMPPGIPGARVIRRRAVLIPVAVAGFTLAALLGSAAAKTFTLKVAKNASVTNQQSHTTKHENIAVNKHGSAVYLLTGDSKAHPECVKSNGCLAVWKPVKVSSRKKLSKAPGIHGKLGIWRRNGFRQVTLGGHPLYTFVLDHQKHAAIGEGIHSFGGTWHVIKTAGASGGGSSGGNGTTTSGTTTGGTTTTTTTPCLYPPC